MRRDKCFNRSGGRFKTKNVGKISRPLTLIRLCFFNRYNVANVILQLGYEDVYLSFVDCRKLKHANGGMYINRCQHVL